MVLPRPSRPSVLWQDLKQLVATRQRHQWLFFALAVAMPVVIVSIFAIDFRQAHVVGPQLVYVQSWPANRSDDQIKAQQKIDQVARHAALAERRRQFQKLARDLGIE